MRVFISAFFVLFLAVKGFSQPLTEIPIPYMMEAAEKAEMEKDLITAIEWYEKVYDQTRDIELAYKIAHLYKDQRDYLKAARAFGRVASRDRNKQFPEAPFYQGWMEQYLGDNKKSVELIGTYLTENPEGENAERARLILQSIKDTWEIQDMGTVIVTPIGDNINTPLGESSPFIDAEGNLYYTSFNEEEPVPYDEEEGVEKFFQMYRSAMVQEDTKKTSRRKTASKGGNWEKGELLNTNINRQGYHIGSGCLSDDEKVLYFTRVEIVGNIQTSSKLFFSVFDKGDWGPAMEVEGVNGDYFIKHPETGELFGEKVIFFASDMPGGEGGFDLYYAPFIEDGVYGSPVNLGPVINTRYDEVSPYYSEGVLHFSSDGLIGFGGFDIYKTSWDGSKWSAPENMGRGYNSTFDDLFFQYSEQGLKGFIVSNREGTKSSQGRTCCDDIFFFEKTEPKVDLIASFMYRGKPLKAATVEIYTVERGITTLVSTISNPDSSQYKIPLEVDKNYKIIAYREDFSKDSTTVNTIGLMKSQTIKKDFSLKYMRRKPEVEVVTINEAIRLSNIYYDYDDDKILSEAEGDLFELLELMENYPTMKIELSSHTDARGNDNYNEDLSQRRANSAKKWLVERGVEDGRITPKGYGEKQILNHCTNGVTCTDDEHRVNRRTEFKILEGPKTIEIKKEVLRGKQSPAQAKPAGKEGAPAKANTPPSRPGPPVLTFDNPYQNLGTIKKGEKKEFSFPFTNTGESPLVIQMITACECTTLKWTKVPVEPGKKGMIVGLLDSEAKGLGEDTIYLEVLSNTDPKITEARYDVNIVE